MFAIKEPSEEYSPYLWKATTRIVCYKVSGVSAICLVKPNLSCQVTCSKSLGSESMTILSLVLLIIDFCD